MKKQLKDKERTFLINLKMHVYFKEKMIFVEIRNGHCYSSMSFPITKKGTKELLNFIKEEVYLK